MAATTAEPELQRLQHLMMVGAVVGLVAIPFSIIYRARVFASRHDINTEMPPKLYERYIQLKAGLDFAMSINILAGYLIRGTRLETRAAATALGALQQFEEVASLWLLYRMGEMPFRFLVLKDDASDQDIFLFNTFKGAAGLGLLFTIPPLAANLYGDNGLFFWFRAYKAEFYAFYWFALLIYLLCVVNFARISHVSEHRRRRALQHVRYGDYFNRMTVEVAAMLTFAGTLWLLPYALRILSWGYAHRHAGRRAPWCRHLDVFSVGFRGPFGVLVYIPKDGIVAVYRLLRRLWTWRRRPRRRWQEQEQGDLEAARAASPVSEKEKKESVRLMLLGPTRPLPFFTELPAPRFEERRLFVSTFNCGECGLEPLVEKMGEWIPRGMAVYVIGVQECLVMGGLKEAVLDHLGRETYMCWDDAIGSNVTALGYHGFIGLLVLARIEDVQNGSFMIYESQRQRVARGKNLGLARAQNKGGVGLAFRYFDTAFGCCSVHLASDSHGRSKLSQRLRDAHDLMAQTTLWKEAYKDLDLQHQHHVTIFLGDLNFRLKRGCPRRVLEDVARICRQEKDGRYGGQADWRRVAYDAVLTGEKRAGAGSPALSLGPTGTNGGAAPAPRSNGNGNGGNGASEGAEAEAEDDDGEDECSSHGGDEEEEEEEEEEEGDQEEEEERGLPPLKEEQEEAHRHVSFLRPRRPTLSAASSLRRSMVRETWEEFVGADELWQAMQAGEILHGFVEGEIRFPPSYRRVRGAAGDCRDYTDAGLLQQAYSTVVKDKARLKRMLTSSISAISSASPNASTILGRVRPGGPHTMPVTKAPSSSNSLPETAHQTSAASSSSSSTNLTGSAASEPGKSSLPEQPPPAQPSGGSSGRHSSIRIPSYTDRILLHVQPERRSRVTLEAYDACDAMTSSDHKPVASIISVRVDTGLAGLGSFLPMIRHHHPTTTSSTTTSTPTPTATEAASASSVPRPPPPAGPTICSVQDAAFFQLIVSNVAVDFAPGAARGLFPPEAARPDHSILQCPMAFEDVYRDLRRPSYVTNLCREVTWMTAEARVNPFGYVSVKRWRDVERGGFALVTCLRPEWGMRAAVYIRSGRVALGSAVLPLTDEAGQPIAEQKGLRVPTTRGSVHTGFFTCDVRLVQLAIPPRKQRLFA